MASPIYGATEFAGESLTVPNALAPWDARPPEVANLLNAAFASLVIRSAIKEYAKTEGGGMPLSLTYLILPIVLHRETRESLPRTSRTRLHTWLQGNQMVAIGFATRAQRMVEYSREALLFGLQHGILTANGSARIQVAKVRLRKYPRAEGSESGACLERAELVGRLFAATGDATTILSMWGVRP